MVRAKFKVEAIESYGSQGGCVSLKPVTFGSEENEKFFNMTPHGSIEMGTLNDKAFKQFEVGKEFYVDFTPAD